ncbi:MAG: hypothetical protein NVSMB5_13160 [Candidatus Velthaea sp.]
MEIIVLVVIPTVLVTVWAVWYIRRYNKTQREAFDQYAVPLSAVIGGTADKQTLRGTYAGAAVTAYKRALSRSQTDESGYQFEFRIELASQAGGADWSLSGTDAEDIISKEPALRARLIGACAADALSRWPSGFGIPVFSYSAQRGVLEAYTRVERNDIWPDAALFKAQLESLTELDRTNRAANRLEPV